ncbi:MAG: class I SAM-dependent methyltransferase [Thiohalomonadales bacterium]
MAKPSITLDEPLYNYLLDVSLRETDEQQQLRAETSKLEMSIMQISPDQAQFMALLIKLIAAKRIIEIGTFTGYSALSMALALPQEGYLLACDISEEWTSVGKPYWRQAGVADKIDLRLAPALDTLNTAIEKGDSASFDFAFIDADKENQLEYYEKCLLLVKSGGLIAIDNILWGGSVIDTADQQESTVAIRAFNTFIKNDDRVEISLVPIGDGLTLARKL